VEVVEARLEAGDRLVALVAEAERSRVRIELGGEAPRENAVLVNGDGTTSAKIAL
jgi:hypothetical protein